MKAFLHRNMPFYACPNTSSSPFCAGCFVIAVGKERENNKGAIKKGNRSSRTRRKEKGRMRKVENFFVDFPFLVGFIKINVQTFAFSPL